MSEAEQPMLISRFEKLEPEEVEKFEQAGCALADALATKISATQLQENGTAFYVALVDDALHAMGIDRDSRPGSHIHAGFMNRLHEKLTQADDAYKGVA